ncbi:Fur-regulated basic protein FbpA [Metabacillus schmidteae]|uniref:Fur-regulated basic protein FbpA n=1 Tax=Metabacillus schmidteae TaxID=2730405 RepID=UPI001589B477|nr:Fur-regulated basic protein FbpA [Metabacillus schmidteae]
MCEPTKEKSKSEIITALIDHNVYKMPDGRQFYEASEIELKTILYTHSNIKHIC